MPWIPKVSTEENATATQEVEKSQGKGDKGSRKGKGKSDQEKGKSEQWKSGAENQQPKGKDKGKGKGRESEGKDKQTGKGKNTYKEEFSRPAKGDGGKGSKGGGWKGRDDHEAGKAGFKGGKKGAKGKGRSSADDEGTEKPEKPNRSEDMRRQATAFSGKYCTVKKHSSMGCALITFTDVSFRKALVESVTQLELGGHEIKLKPHFDKETNQEQLSEIFVGWGRQAEKKAALPEQDIADYFDQKYTEFMSPEGMQAQRRAQAQRAAALQAQWASSGAQAPAVRPPGGAVPPGPPPVAMPAATPGAAPGAVPGAPTAYAAPPQPLATTQAQQQQMHQAMQARYLQYQQQQQAAYIQAAYQAQQQQQQAWMQHLTAQREAEAAAARKRQMGYKAAYRVPTDDEVKAKFATLNNLATATPAKTTEPTEVVSEAPPAAAESAPPAGDGVAPASTTI